MPESKPVKIQRWRENTLYPAITDMVAIEEPLEIRVRGRSIAVTMRTPGHDEELAAGFLVTENVIHQQSDITEIAHCHKGRQEHLGNTLNVFLSPTVEVDFQRFTRHFFTNSSCGLCGKSRIEDINQQFAPITSEAIVAAQTLAQLPNKLQAAQTTFDETGGLHAAGIFSPKGSLIISREDVGRHNAVDKVIGRAFLDQVDLSQNILLVSGRASFEILQKALAARIPIIAAVSAPSSLAINLANESGQTLAGFVRNKTMNLYTGAQRVQQDLTENTSSHREL
jgi:FdhD protein